jgi:hypothetical protein
MAAKAATQANLKLRAFDRHNLPYAIFVDFSANQEVCLGGRLRGHDEDVKTGHYNNRVMLHFGSIIDLDLYQSREVVLPAFWQVPSSGTLPVRLGFAFGLTNMRPRLAARHQHR